MSETIRFLVTDPVTAGITLMITAALFFGVLAHHRGTHPAARQFAPTFMTSLGILGTFIGIVSGLMDFDTADIDGSIPSLLSGLKTAFLTSIVGMIGTLAFKTLTLRPAPDVLSAQTEDADPVLQMVDILRDHWVALTAIRTAVSSSAESSEKAAALLSDLKQTLNPDNDGSVQSTLHRELDEIRSEFLQRDEVRMQRFDAFEAHLNGELRSFAEKLSEAATGQIINALKDVITTFNEQLTDQFGENFRELNAAVSQLVIWQEKYKEQLSELEGRFRLAVQSLEGTRDAVSVIAEKSEVIPAAMTEFEKAMAAARKELDALEEELKALAKVREEAAQAVPEIGRTIDAMTGSMKNAVEHVAEDLRKTSEDFAGDSAKTRDAFRTAADKAASEAQETAETLKNASQAVKALGNTFAEEAQSIARNIAESTERTLSESRRTVDQLVRDASMRTSESIDHQIRKLDDALTTELNRALQELGSALATIAKAVVDQYEARSRRRDA